VLLLLTMMIRCRCGSIFGQRWQAGYHHDMLLLLMLLGWRYEIEVGKVVLGSGGWRGGSS
jgi:hypothetical protein